MKNQPALESKALCVGYGNKAVVKDLNLQIEKGEMVCLIGPNGSGKSTILRSLAGIQSPLSGEILINGFPLNLKEPRKLAQLISIVLTQKLSPLNFTVFDMVALGRTPHTNWLGQLSSKDKSIVQWAMDIVELNGFESRPVHELSDGEKQRVMVAKALAQDTPIIILDEPTAHLDVMNRIALLSLLKKLSRETGKVILLSTHELDMAIQIADSIWLVDGAGVLKTGSPEDLVINGAINKVFKGSCVEFDAYAGSFRMEYELKKQILVNGNGVLGNWTRKALNKEGYAVATVGDGRLKLAINEGDKNRWHLTMPSGVKEMNSIKELIKVLRNG